MGRTRHRVFVDADCRREVAGHKIMLTAPGRDNCPRPRQFRQRRHVRLTFEHRLLGFQHHEQLVRPQHINRFHTQRALDIQGHAHFRRNERREIQPQALTLTAHTQRAGLADKVQPLDRLFIDFKQNVSAGQGCMTAQRHFGGRSKPADVPVLPFAHHESGFGEVVLGGDLLHQLIGKPGIEAIDHRRVATERPITERIDLMKLKLHNLLPLSGHGA